MTAPDWVLPGDALDDMQLSDVLASALATDVPATYPIAIGGRAFSMEVEQYRRRTLQSVRSAIDSSATGGEQSLSTEGYWRRSQRRWVYGTGQTLFDIADDGVDNLIQRQRYLNAWNCEPDTDTTEGIRMLRGVANDISKTNATPNAPGLSVAAGDYTYVRSTDTNIYRVDSSGATACTGLAEFPSAVASDGYTVWAATIIDTTHIKFYSLTAGGTVFVALGAGSQVVATNKTCGRLFYGNGFLLAACGDEIHSVSVNGTLGAVIDTFTPVSNFNAVPLSITCSTNTWYFTSYVAAVSDFPTPIYKLQIDTTGVFGKLSVALPSLGPTECIVAIKVIGNVILIGTTLGFRIGQLGSDGNINGPGPLIPVVPSTTSGSPNFGVTEFARFGNKIVASYACGSEPFADNIDSTFKNGRTTNGSIMIDLGRFVDVLQPAWWYWWRDTIDDGFTASCFICEHKTTPVLAARNYFHVIGTTNLITPCAFITSWVSYSLDADKTFVDLEVFHDPLVAGDKVALYAQYEDETTWALIGTSQQVGTITNPDPFPLRQSSRRVRFAFLLTAGSAAQSTTPRVRRWQMRSFPDPILTDEIICPVILGSDLQVGEDEAKHAYRNAQDDFDFLHSLVGSGGVTLYQEGSATLQVKLDRLELQPAKYEIAPDSGYRFYQGFCLVRMLTL
jgi:hypothetical protein